MISFYWGPLKPQDRGDELHKVKNKKKMSVAFLQALGQNLPATDLMVYPFYTFKHSKTLGRVNYHHAALGIAALGIAA